MDSLTQLALGAAVGEATAGRQVGRRALLWGAALGTMPDLDVFIPLGDAVRDFTYHRSASHSLFVLLALTPLMVWLILKLHPGTAEHRRRWVVLVYLVFATHVLLDSFTVYGTQIFWPFFTTPMTWSTIFIIDPLYTVPLLLGIIAALIAARDRTWGHTANMIGLVLSSGYLVWTVGVKLHVEQVARNALQQQEVVSSAVLTTPTPFNSLLWRILAVNEEHCYEGFYSVLDDEPRIRFERYLRMRELVAPLHDSWPVQTAPVVYQGLLCCIVERPQYHRHRSAYGIRAGVRVSLQGRGTQQSAPSTNRGRTTTRYPEFRTPALGLGSYLEREGMMILRLLPLFG